LLIEPPKCFRGELVTGLRYLKFEASRNLDIFDLPLLNKVASLPAPQTTGRQFQGARDEHIQNLADLDRRLESNVIFRDKVPRAFDRKPGILLSAWTGIVVVKEDSDSVADTFLQDAAIPDDNPKTNRADRQKKHRDETPPPELEKASATRALIHPTISFSLAPQSLV